MTDEERAIREALAEAQRVVAESKPDPDFGLCTLGCIHNSRYVDAAVNGLPAILTALDTARAGEARLREAAERAHEDLFMHLADRSIVSLRSCVDRTATALQDTLSTPASTWLTERDRATRVAALREAAWMIDIDDITTCLCGVTVPNEHRARSRLIAIADAIAEGREPT